MGPDHDNPPAMARDAPDDDALMALASGGDSHAFRILFDRWAPRVRSFLVRSLTSRADADDLTQETFVRAWRAAGRYEAEGRFPAWIFRIAGNLARQEVRRRRVRGWFRGTGGEPDDDEVLGSLPAPSAFDPEGRLRDEETRLALARALARLPERQRLAVLLRYFEGLPVRDVAAALGKSEHAAESLLARGTAALRKTLGPLRE
jgi:RNA polymerase sigma-70 factor (ECF subfamily)